MSCPDVTGYHGGIINSGGRIMKLLHDLGNQEIKVVLAAHPAIGAILARRDIGCVKCGVGTCLLKDVVMVHHLGTEAEAAIAAEINAYLRG